MQESGTIQNQLRKHISFERELLQIFGHITGGKSVCVWMSDTLTWDLNLPVTTPLPFLPGFLQAFVICVGRPPFLVSLYSKGDDSAKVETYGRDMARILHWSLLDFCHLDFAVLPVHTTLDAFRRGTVELEEDIKAKITVVNKYFKSPLNLNDDTFAGLRAATTALVGATFVPCLLKDEPRDTVRNTYDYSVCLFAIYSYFVVFVWLFLACLSLLLLSWSKSMDQQQKSALTGQAQSAFISRYKKDQILVATFLAQSHWYYNH